VTDFVYRFSIIPLVAPAILTLLATLLEHDGGNPDVPKYVAGLPGLSAPATPDETVRSRQARRDCPLPATPDEREGKASVSWRFGGR
jgi:hypothetical protein